MCLYLVSIFNLNSASPEYHIMSMHVKQNLQFPTITCFLSMSFKADTLCQRSLYKQHRLHDASVNICIFSGAIQSLKCQKNASPGHFRTWHLLSITRLPRAYNLFDLWIVPPATTSKTSLTHFIKQFYHPQGTIWTVKVTADRALCCKKKIV